jgi:hypothetical protein
VISQTNASFRVCYHALPEEIQRLARENFHLWQTDAFNPWLHF